MSSFSSVIRKPGGKIAPKVAPKRNIVRKTAVARSEAIEKSPAIEDAIAKTNDVSRSDVQDIVTASRNTVPAVDATEEHPGERETATTSAINTDTVGTENVASIAATGASSPSRSSVLSPDWPAEDAPHDATIPSIWPSQKTRPESNPPPASAPITAPTPTEPDVANAPDTVNREPTRSKSRRKQVPRGGAAILFAPVPTPPPTQPSASPEHIQPTTSTIQRSASVVSHRSEAELILDKVHSDLLKVGQIAAGIQAGIPSDTRPRDTSATTAEAPEDDIVNAGTRSRPKKRRKRNNDTSNDVQDQVADIIANALGKDVPARGRGRRRYDTPENPETQEIDQESTMMGDILDDKFKYGKKSEIEKQMEANWPEILRRRKEDAEIRLKIAQEGRRRKKNPVDESAATANKSNGNVEDDGYGFEQVVENGQIVIVSREVDRQAITARTVAQADDANIRDDDIIYKRVNATTISSKAQIAPGQTWDEIQTGLFYQGLKMFGTDFMMISNMIPGKTRKQVKLKYNVEERAHWPRVQMCLSQKEEVDLDEYSQMTGLEMSNVADVYKQMEEDEKRLREEDEARRREEGIISQDQAATENADGQADVIMPSIEGQDADGAATADGVQASATDRQSTAGVSRLGSTTTGRHTAQPTGKKKQTKKSASATKRGKQNANKNRGFEGVEERLGDVGDIGIPGA